MAGLDEELRTLDRKNLRDRHPAYLRSRLSLTEFGRAVLGHKEDFSRHNPIDRWWGGTHLTNDNLWRWNPALSNHSGATVDRRMGRAKRNPSSCRTRGDDRDGYRFAPPILRSYSAACA